MSIMFRYIVVGGEDDLVHVYSVQAKYRCDTNYNLHQSISKSVDYSKAFEKSLLFFSKYEYWVP